MKEFMEIGVVEKWSDGVLEFWNIAVLPC